MFDLLPNAVTAAVAVLFPAFASYKAIATSSPAHLTPWLTYFLTLTLFHTLEWTFPFSIIPAVLPGYAYLRLFAHVYLLLPGQTQGASFVYNEYIEPFIAKHERQIEQIIGQVHATARGLGFGNIERVWELVRNQIFGPPPPRPAVNHAPTPPTSDSYVSSLLSRFTAPIPSAPKSDVYGLLSSALSQATSFASSSNQANIVPKEIPRHERARYIEDQRQKLRDLLDAFDREAASASSTPSASRSTSATYRRNQSETDFDQISRDEVSHTEGSRQSSGSGWSTWLGGSAGQVAQDGAHTSGHDLAYGRDYRR